MIGDRVSVEVGRMVVRIVEIGSGGAVLMDWTCIGLSVWGLRL